MLTIGKVGACVVAIPLVFLACGDGGTRRVIDAPVIATDVFGLDGSGPDGSPVAEDAPADGPTLDAPVICDPACAPGLECVNAVCREPINFETIPGGAPTDNLAIGMQFEAMYGVTFGLDTDLDGLPNAGALPVLAQVGDPATAFLYDTGNVGDTGAPAQNIGSFFLTDDGVVAGPPAPLIITYSSPVAAASGQTVDIDGLEGWTVDARDANNAVIDSIAFTSGEIGTGDGIATTFSFSHVSADIYSIRVRYTGAAGQGVGLAFDNFSTSTESLAQ